MPTPRTLRRLTVAAVIAVNGCSCDDPLVYDIDNDVPDGTASNPLSSPAGLIMRVDGTATTLYAVSLNAGVWRSTPPTYYGAWVQLWKSPRYAYSIAVDPRDVRHLIVGERDGDNADPATNHAGVWESTDGGDTWPNYFDPRSLNAGCGSQAIPSVAISATGTLVVATNCGIAVRPQGGAWRLATLPRGFPNSRVTAVAASESRVWARDAAYALVVADANALTFTAATAQARPAQTAGATGDIGTLAAFDSAVVMVALGNPFTVTQPGDQNLTRLLIFDANRDRWIVQESVAGALNGNGGFAIGRRFAKAYVIPGGKAWGVNRQLFVSNAQEVYRATGRNNDGTFAFENVAGSSSGTPSALANWTGTLHVDLWDFHFAPDGKAAWVAGDGGIDESLMDGKGWHTRSQSLHTHHVQDLYVPHDELHLVAATMDNDAWERMQPGTSWKSAECLGDANYIAGDAGHPSAVLMVRNVGDAVLSGFGTNLPSSGQKWICGITLNNDQTFFQSPLAFRFIQTRKGEQTNALLDAVMLTRLPFAWRNGRRALITAINNGQGFALIRNTTFEANYDVNIAQGKGWALAADNLPEGPIGFWVAGASGGQGAHATPIYFLLARPGGVLTLLRSGGPVPGTTWTPIHLYNNGQADNFATSPSDRYRFGPVFVNPYNADVVYVLTTTGVLVSTNGMAPVPTFTRDDALSTLVSRQGRFAFAAGLAGGNRTNVDEAIHNGGWPLEALADMAFAYDDPTQVIAGSAFGGVFVNLGDGQWRDLSPYLPTVLSPVASVGLARGTAYIGTLGRGVLEVQSLRDAKVPKCGPPRRPCR